MEAWVCVVCLYMMNFPAMLVLWQATIIIIIMLPIKP
jgi:hypothetical protein